MHGVLPLLLAGLMGLQGYGTGFSAGAQRWRITPIPSTGGVPLMYDPAAVASVRDLAIRAEARDYAGQISEIARRTLRQGRSDTLRAKGIAELREFTDPAAFRPLWDELREQRPDVIVSLLDQFLAGGAEGQAALAYAAIHAPSKVVRDEAVRRLVSPPPEEVLRELDTALRDQRHAVVNAAGFVAGQLGALPAIPLLIFTQATGDRVEQTGDLAWIVVGTQTTYVANLVPAVGDASGAFQPILGVVNEGTLLRVMDAVVVTYRIDVHNALVAMTSAEWGRPTDHLGYNMREWWNWYNGEFVPFRQEQERLAALERALEEQAAASRPPAP